MIVVIIGEYEYWFKKTKKYIEVHPRSSYTFDVDDLLFIGNLKKPFVCVYFKELVEEIKIYEFLKNTNIPEKVSKLPAELVTGA